LGEAGGFSATTSCSAVIRNNTISGNSAGLGGGIAVAFWSNVAIAKTIISFSGQGEAVFCDRSEVVLSCCDVYGNAGGDWVDCISYQFGSDGNFRLGACGQFPRSALS